MDRTEALSRLESARVAHLATVRPDGSPHVVPATFALAGNFAVTMVDHKPKSTTRLQRLANVEANGTASLLVDHFSEDWSELWWVRVDGNAAVHQDGPGWREASAALAAKYEQYRHRPPTGPAIVIALDRVNYWASTP